MEIMGSQASAPVTCQEADAFVDRYIDQLIKAMPAGVRAHIASCGRCAKLYGWVISESLGEPVSAELEQRLRERIHGALTPVKPLPSGRLLAARFVFVFLLLMALFFVPAGFAGLESMSGLQVAVVVTVLGAATVFLSLSLSWQMIPGVYHRIPAPWIIGAFAAGFVAVVALLFPWEARPEILSHGWDCTRFGLMMAAPVAVVLVVLAVRGAPLSYRTLGASVGATASLCGLTVLQFACHNQHAGHLIVWHGGVVLISVFAGYVLGWAAETLAARRAGAR